MLRIRLQLAALLLTLSAVGCGDGGTPLFAVKGTVTLDGKPLGGKTLKFIPEAGTPGQGGGGTTNSAGEFYVLADRPGAVTDMVGLPAGAYRVTVSEPLIPIDTAMVGVTESPEGIPAPAIGIPMPSRKKKQEIPPVYGSEAMSPLRATVPEGGGTVDLVLESAKKR